MASEKSKPKLRQTEPPKQEKQAMAETATGRAEAGKNSETPTKKTVYQVCFLGHSTLDKRYTQSMLPWVMAEVKRDCHEMKFINLHVEGHTLRAVAVQDDKETDEILFEHKLQNISRFARAHLDHTIFTYLTRTNSEHPFCCYVFQAMEDQLVPELFTTIRSATKEAVRDYQLHLHSREGKHVEDMGELMKTGYQFYEVLYTGKVIVSHKKAPATFIDEAVLKFRQHEEKKRLKLERENEKRVRHGSGASVKSLPTNLENSVDVKENELSNQSQTVKAQSNDSTGSSTSGERSTGSSEMIQDALHVSASDDSLKDRIESHHTVIIDNNSTKTTFSISTGGQDEKAKENQENLMKTVLIGQSHLPGSGEKNRTMLFQIGMEDICLISPDKKSVILERRFKDISFVSQGIKEPDHFGFISREPATGQFMCYVFRCAVDSVVEEIMQALKQSFHNAFQQSAKNHIVCELCPMHQLHKLCLEIEHLAPKRRFEVILNKIDQLGDKEKDFITAKFKAENPQGYEEMNEVFMMLLRHMCEAKQKEHIHISGDSTKIPPKTEFNLYNNQKPTSKFDFFKSKAKKSLANSFENLIKRKLHILEEPNEPQPGSRGRSWTTESDNSLMTKSLDCSSTNSTPNTTPFTSPVSKTFGDVIPWDSPESPREEARERRPRSSTIGAIPTQEQRQELSSIHAKAVEDVKNETHDRLNSPRKSIFMQSHIPRTSITQLEDIPQSPTPTEEDGKTPKRRGSWRQAIFHKVVTPIAKSERTSICEEEVFGEDANKDYVDDGRVHLHRHSSAALRALWRKAIWETRLLIRMEKENRSLQANQDAANSKRLKLDYEEVTPCLKEVTKVWDEMCKSPDRATKKIDFDKLMESVKKGVPRPKRGLVWQLLVEQHKLHNPGVTKTTFNFDINVSYKDLLKELTTHQHAILIDLGRTFPQHPYFSTQLGTGQLSLFNLLKAYSLLDQEVGYCQGLSFVAGVLLMHMPETEAFCVLRYMMFYLGFRRQYRPDMVSLQIQMYQLQRLLHDHHRDLYEHFEMHEIHPTLYAAPWFLTLFASQFPLGFVARVFDLLFVQGLEVIFKVALVVLGSHKELILQCDSFETIVSFLKTTLPEMGIIQMERVINQVFALDISKQLNAYEVEYHVLQEEMVWTPPSGDADIEKLEASNRNLKRQNMELIEQLQTSHSNNHTLEVTVSNLQSSVSLYKSRISTLELERQALLNAVVQLRELVPPEKLSASGINIPHFSTDISKINSNNLENRQASVEEEDNEVAILTSGSTNQRRSRHGSSGSIPTFSKSKLGISNKRLSPLLLENLPKRLESE